MVLLAVTSVVAEAAAVETVGNRINYLIEKISSGEYDPELLSEGEKAQLADVLKRDVTLKK